MSEHEATLERRIYARLDESLGPINEALDAVTLRLDRLAEEYATLTSRIVGGGDPRFNLVDAGAANFQSFKETADCVFNTFEAQFQTLERRDKQVELQLEGLAADIVRQVARIDDHLGDTRLRIHALEHNIGTDPGQLLSSALSEGTLRDEVQQLDEAVKTAHAVNAEQSQRITHQAHRIDALSDDLISRTYGLKEERDALSDRVSMLENAATTDAAQVLRDRLDIVESHMAANRKAHDKVDAKIEELTHALEDHVRDSRGVAAPSTFIIRNATDKPITVEPPARSMVDWPHLPAVGWKMPEPQDTYEVDGHPATKAEYEAAENDAKAPHTTRHVHLPFSAGGLTQSADAPDEVHDIGWAMEQLAAGKKVRRADWNVHIYWVVYRNTIRLHHSGEPLIWRDDIEATDWEIVP